MQELRNRGFSVLRATAPTDTATIIVVGVARSGTSMVASALRAMGVFLGDQVHDSVHEDIEIAAALEERNDRLLTELIDSRNAAHKIWGFKRPESFLLLSQVLKRFRNPRLVVTFRDPAAISQRNAISVHTDFLVGLGDAAEKTVALIKFIGDVDVPTMSVSYEKAMSDPEAFVGSLVQFCGLKADDSQIAAALATIASGPALYLNSSRIWFEGRFDGIASGHAFGWIRQMPEKQPCHIEIVSDGVVIGTGASDQPSAELGEQIGERAFAIKLLRQPGEDVFARVIGTTYIIERSPEFLRSFKS
ncbi:MAG TPA: sulfotransferase [Mesorhizobium sp.]